MYIIYLKTNAFTRSFLKEACSLQFPAGDTWTNYPDQHCKDRETQNYTSTIIHVTYRNKLCDLVAKALATKSLNVFLNTTWMIADV